MVYLTGTASKYVSKYVHNSNITEKLVWKYIQLLIL